MYIENKLNYTNRIKKTSPHLELDTKISKLSIVCASRGSAAVRCARKKLKLNTHKKERDGEIKIDNFRVVL